MTIPCSDSTVFVEIASTCNVAYNLQSWSSIVSLFINTFPIGSIVTRIVQRGN